MKVFVTGGGGGIGQSIVDVLRLSHVAVVSPSSKELDLSSDFNLEEYGEFDGFIHCAGINSVRECAEIDQGELDNLFKINTFSFLKISSELKLRQGANIVAIGSLYAESTKEGRVQYSMSKHALYGAVKTLALEMAKDRVKVNMISPGFVDTPMTAKNNTKDRIDYLNNTIPLGLTNPSQVSKLCLYFITQNEAVTGQNIVVDGGCSLKGL
mgnify:CR=1 FL=1